MNTETAGQIIFAAQSVGYVGLCYVLPFAYVLRTGRFWHGVGIGWVTAAAFAFVSMWIGQFLYRCVAHGLASYCFEGPQFLMFMVFGWFQGMIVCLPAIIIHQMRKKRGKIKVG
jgi:hypothetical protein